MADESNKEQIEHLANLMAGKAVSLAFTLSQSIVQTAIDQTNEIVKMSMAATRAANDESIRQLADMMSQDRDRDRAVLEQHIRQVIRQRELELDDHK